MKIGILGTGMVGETIGTKLVQLEHEVKIGSRTADNPKAHAWAQANGSQASHGTFADAAAFGEILFNCTAGVHSLEALEMAGAAHLRGKILVDVANPLDFSQGMPPTLAFCNTDSLGERIQRAFPETRVVKTLNTVNCNVMVNPALVGGEHDMFVCGNDAEAKATVTRILKEWFGWPSVIDLGDIRAARATEMMLPVWIALWGVLGTPMFGFKVVRGTV
jgi:predicted dinucleotide-binding enzyme